MSNTADYDDLIADGRDDSEGGGSGGAAIAVLLTLLLGCGLVFAAYKLGQKTGVDDPPLLGADSRSIKVTPADAGGLRVANTQNASNALIDGRPPLTARLSNAPAIAVERTDVNARTLPLRNLDVSTNREAAQINRTLVPLEDLEPQTSIAGAPTLTQPGPVDRREETLRLGAAEVIVPVDGGARQLPQRVGNESLLAPGRGQIETAALSPPSATLNQQGVRQQGVRVTQPTAPQAATLDAQNALRQRQAAIPNAPAENASTLAAPAQDAQRVPTQRAPTQSVLQQTTPRAPEVAIQRLDPTVPSVGGVPPQPPGDAQIQLGAMPNPTDVRREWNRLRAQHPDLLGRLGLQVLPTPGVSGNPLFRLRVGPLPDGRAAAQLCSQLQYRGIACFVPPRS